MGNRGRSLENVTVFFSIIRQNRYQYSAIAFLGMLGGGLLTLVLLGWLDGFNKFHVPAMTPVFADIRTIPGAWESVLAGLDPRVDNPGDPWNRPFNYPEIWLFIFKPLAWVGDPVLLFGTAQALILALAGFIFTRRRHGWLAVLVFFAPPSLLLMERGNTEIGRAHV